ncbi:metal-dependent hydrolase [Winogradskyella alexanderae]|uniref:Metal-dependent hydrolase n=1 Tax=Winogradskyella alexanderae TaxID=2877123 RepID=A0ABS7XTH7_9FLAO|nr:metal-dependent hydrolase [Winogradskyella alexanderae]MCA0132743.1 metal-dependent hydrolase [Winogradskyella alexanderae]
MDSLTQIVLGASVGELTLGKKAGNKALLYGAIAGTIPDLDVFFGKLTDTITAIEWHRGFSHSIVFSLIMAPLLGVLVNKIEKRLNLGWKPWANLFFWGLFTHPLLDAFTTWGTQLFWPLDWRVAFNSIFVVDPLYTIPFLLCLILVLFLKRTSKRRRQINHFGLILSSTYLLVTLVLKQIALSKFEQALEDQNISYTKISTRPSPLNTILWNANVDTEDNYLIADYSFFDTKPITFKAYEKRRAQSEDLVFKTNIKRLITISEGWYIIEKKDENWYFNDLRFGLIPRKDKSPMFVFSYLLEDENGEIKATEVTKTRGDAKFLLSSLWIRFKGN